MKISTEGYDSLWYSNSPNPMVAVANVVVTSVDGREEFTYENVIEGERSAIRTYLIGMIEDLAEHAPYVSGDDEYFDYFPQQLDMLEDLIKQMNEYELTERFEALREWCYQVTYHDLEPYVIGVTDERPVDQEVAEAAATIANARRRILWRHLN